MAYSSNRSGRFGLYWQPVGGTAGAERLIESRNLMLPGSWTPDGRHILYAEFDPESRWDLWLLPLYGERTPRPFLKTPRDEWRPALSPDGRLVAYVSNESGERDVSKRWEVYVRSFDDPTARLRISTHGGGTDPVWGRDGRELVFREGSNLMAVAIETEPELAVGVPRAVFDGLADTEQAFDVAPDGSFVVVRQPPPGAAPALRVIQGFTRETRAPGAGGLRQPAFILTRS